MAESKHTPGPWECGRAPEEPDTILIGAEATLFCRVVGTPGSPAEPNARLITAAPDLLGALRTLMREREFEKIEGGGERYWSPCNSDGWRKAAAAIARAEGK